MRQTRAPDDVFLAKTRSLVNNIVAYASFVPTLKSFVRQLRFEGFR